jgi:hypothetical protein
MSRRTLFARVVAAILWMASAAPAVAQNARTATLRVTVVDQTGAVIVGATVTVRGAEPATQAAAPVSVQTSTAGLASITGLRAGRYAIDAAFTGFETKTLPNVGVRNGDNRQTIVLEIGRLEADVTVEQDRDRAAADRQAAGGTSLSRDQIQALSDDPATFQQQLQDMAGPGAVIRIDGFEGSSLPPKAQIRSIRIARDQFAAEYHGAGGTSIEIITQPGIGPIRYFTNMNVRSGALSARSPFVPVRGPERFVNYGFGLGGTLVKDKSSFNFNAFGFDSYETPNLNVALPGGGRSQLALPIRSPRDNVGINAQVDYAVTLDQTLRFGYQMGRFTNGNAGIGGYDEPERAYSSENENHNVRIQHFGPVGRRAFSRSRLQFSSSDSSSESLTNAPTIRVIDAFTRGGAQRTGGDHSRTVNMASDLDYVLGRHSLRAGFLLDSTWYQSDAMTNDLGTYTFANPQAFLEGRPSNYSRRIGNPNVSYVNVQGGLYIQDDIRVRRNLTLTPGIRYEYQTHVGDRANFGPRVGVTWAPFAGGQTTFRTSAGIFYDWLSLGTYDQSLRGDGVRLRELNIVNPPFPDPGTAGTVPPLNRYILGSHYHAPRLTRVSVGLDQTVMRVTRVSATYSYQRGSRLARGQNMNAAMNGVRPDPSFAAVVDVRSDAASRQHQLQIDAAINPGALLPVVNGPLVSWKRSTVFANYSLATMRNNTDGPFSLPATGGLEREWGPGAPPSSFVGGPFFGGGGFGGGGTDVRSRLNATYNNQIVKNVMIGLGIASSTAPAYTRLTGTDDNSDGVFNDRPTGVRRNTLRASGQTTAFGMFGYQFAFGRRATLPPGVGVFGGGGSAQVRTFDQGTARYRLQLSVFVQNLTNRKNYVGYSGNQLSPSFMQPTSVSGMRKIDFSIGLSF